MPQRTRSRLAFHCPVSIRSLPQPQNSRKATVGDCSAWLSALDRQIASLPAAPPDRAQLRVVLEQRVADWKQRLRSDHVEEARFIVEQLLRLTPITLWNADSYAETLEAVEALGVDPKDMRGKENIELEDCFGFEVCVHLASLFEGFDGAL